MAEDSFITIGRLAERTGVAVSAIRFYEEKGLIASIGRRGLRRLFDPGVLERLALIALGGAAGFSLVELLIAMGLSSVVLGSAVMLSTGVQNTAAAKLSGSSLASTSRQSPWRTLTITACYRRSGGRGRA